MLVANPRRVISGRPHAREAAAKPMRGHFRYPLRTFFTQSVEHAPERAVRHEPIAGIVKRAMVEKAQEEIEKAPARVVLGPLHKRPQSRNPRTSLVRVWLEQLG